ncbi:molybdate ABC transporter substrate-binding protein [Gordonia sp. (in: high G+C Gram-positive bacteria)]|uniref:molybdate ABC transporter substrate-binding protein n=1 Tax=Gordonia sp. (in: high G+C Gram-positive bacteria) TaxID=84139 RepID=UPI0016AD81B2|nr:molybdate ABC transporter substrate-binding protein [Gordonia sp. (in: high G+C Gram-positive bacteria)]NLG46136.1 molybdate ABC transporter substrate-binding protein [Gordonia sp. (in: high G+C Gram-positive bacteria)]
MSKKLLAVVAALALLLTGCAGGDGSDQDTVTVFAAASLQGAFDELADEFSAAHPGYRVAPMYDGSQALATQLVEGADADVVAFANEPSLKPVTEAGIADAGQIFATNTLQIAVAPGNPKNIRSLADLARADVTTVLCAPQVPCGKASRTLLDDAKVAVKPRSEETNVTAVVKRVEAGEADAGLVYKTDVAAAGDELVGITPAHADAVVNRYPIAVVTKAPSPDGAQAFVDFVLSAAGRQVLTRYGFGSP